jgi:hypothetical protein
LDGLEIPIRLVVDSRGDVGNLGKGDAGGAGGSINRALTNAVYPPGHTRAGQPVLGFPIITAAKRTLAEDTELINTGLSSGALFIDTSCDALAVAIENWSGGESYKDDVDAWRYVVTPVVRRWTTKSGCASG